MYREDRALAAGAPIRSTQDLGASVRSPRGLRGDAEAAAFRRRVAAPFYHASGTCGMGPDGDAVSVVTPDRRLRRTDNVRIVDGSIFPRIPQAMMRAAVMAVAEHAADLIGGEVALRPS